MKALATLDEFYPFRWSRIKRESADLAGAAT